MDHRSAGLAESRLPRTRERAVRRAVGRRGAAPRAARVPPLLRGRAREDARGRYQLRHQAGHPPGSRETRRALSRSPLSQHLLPDRHPLDRDRKSTRLNSSHGYISYAVFCLKKKKKLKQATAMHKWNTFNLAHKRVTHIL